MKSFHLYLVVMFIVGCNIALAWEAYDERLRYRACIKTYSREACQ
jgi:hypothetical protein